MVKFIRGAVALLIACLLYYLGDRMLGVTLELFWGDVIKEFTDPRLLLDLFLLPFVVGLLTTMIFGVGGKWLSHFPPFIVRSINYYQFAYVTGVPHGARLMPLGFWGFFVVLAIEACFIGGVVGEVMIKSIYGRSPRHKIYKARADDEEGGQV